MITRGWSWRTKKSSWRRLFESNFSNKHITEIAKSIALTVIQQGGNWDCFWFFCSSGNNHSLIKGIINCGSRFCGKGDLDDNQRFSRHKTTGKLQLPSQFDLPQHMHVLSIIQVCDKRRISWISWRMPSIFFLTEHGASDLVFRTQWYFSSRAILIASWFLFYEIWLQSRLKFSTTCTLVWWFKYKVKHVVLWQENEISFSFVKLCFLL